MISTELFFVPSNLVIAMVLTAFLVGYNVRVMVDTIRLVLYGLRS